MIGCNPSNKQCFNGLFDEFRVWNVARSATEIMTNYNKSLTGTETGLVGYWKLDQGQGTAVRESISGNDGVLSAAGATWAART